MMRRKRMLVDLDQEIHDHIATATQTIGVIAHRQCRLIWLILHDPGISARGE